ncbi:hypothetical protein AURDEDRAFT_176342 [Auricularia subglabra TFB-10046 SS5]|nr:hypothetical protein AURDEDRAFT_176342 [Auricularia subglabra TFB-10046 SS5]
MPSGHEMVVSPSPLPDNPTPEQIAREAASRKRKAEVAADEEAERAREIRAIVHRADNRHLREAITPVINADEARATSDFHAANWVADCAPCSAISLPAGALPGATFTLEEVVYFCENGPAWLNILRAASKDPMAKTGYACLALALNWYYDPAQVAAVRALNCQELARDRRRLL